MIVAASLEGGKPVLAGFLEDVPMGARLEVKLAANELVDSHCHLDDTNNSTPIATTVIERACDGRRGAA